MTNEQRFEEFKKIFPDSDYTFKKWSKLKRFEGHLEILSVLDTSIFPDTLKELLIGGYYLREMIICPTLTKLTGINLMASILDEFIIPKEVKGITNLNLTGPIRKIDLGGSLKSIKTLLMVGDIYSPLVGIPKGMASVETLKIGYSLTDIVLDESMPRLHAFELDDCKDDIKITISSKLTNLSSLHLDGKIKEVILTGEDLHIDDLWVESDNPDIILPPNLKACSISLLHGAVAGLLPEWGETCKALFLNTTSFDKAVVPKSFANLTSLRVICSGWNGGKYTKVVLPDVSGVRAITLHNVNTKIVSSLDELVELRLASSNVRFNKDIILPKLKVYISDGECKVDNLTGYKSMTDLEYYESTRASK